MADGWISARAGSGIFVSDEAPRGRPHALAQFLTPAKTDSKARPLAITYGSVDDFPLVPWARIQSKIWKAGSTSALGDECDIGWPALRSAIAAHLNALRGIRCDSNRILIVSSTQSAIDLIFRAVAQAGEPILMENPGYPAARAAIRAHRLQEIVVPIDAEGISIAEGEMASPEARLAYVTPACQFPTCSVMSASRRRELLGWAERKDAFIVEDDWNSHAFFESNHPPDPLASTNPDRVFYIYSFNRIMFPGIRIAALIPPARFVDKMLKIRRAIDCFTNVANQMALEEFIRRGFLSGHMRASRLTNLARRAAMHRAVLAHMPDFVTVDPVQAGLHVVAELHQGADGPLAAKARRRGFDCSALSDFSLGTPSRQALLLGFAAFTNDVIERSVADLSRALFDEDCEPAALARA
jgi:GntR family transcriptional regulator/MocR family aminotransferase